MPIIKPLAITLHKHYYWWTRVRGDQKDQIVDLLDILALERHNKTDAEIIVEALETLISLEVL